MAKKLKLSTEDAVKEVQDLIVQLKSLDKNIGKISKGNIAAFNKMSNSMGGFKSKITELNNTIKRLGDLTKTNSKRLTRNSNEIKRNADLTKTNSKNKRANTRAINNNTKALNKETTASNKNTKSKKSANSAGTKLFGTIGNLAGALGFGGLLVAIVSMLTSIVKLSIKFQSLGFAISQTSQSVFETGRSFQFLLELNNRFGASLVSTTERWLKFRTAARQSGLTLLETKKIFSSVTKASAVLGLATDELRGVYLALEQMLSKGKVTTEELRRQLGERLPGAMGIMAASMGVTIVELDKMLKKGEVLSAEVLPNFAIALEEAYGIDKIENVNNLSTAIGKTTGQWQQFVLAVSSGDSLINKAIGGTLSLVEKILFNMTRIAMNFKQTAQTAQGYYRDDIIKEYSDRADNIIQKNKEFKRSMSGISKEIEDINKGIIANADKGDSVAEKKLRNRKKLLLEEKRIIQQRRDFLISTDAQARYEKEFKITESLKEELIASGQIDETFIQKWKEVSDLIGKFRADGGEFTPKEKVEKEEELNKAYDERKVLIDNMTVAQRAYTKQLERKALTIEFAEVGFSELTPGNEESSSNSKIVKAKEFIETNKVLIATLKESVRIRREDAKLNKESIESRIESTYLNIDDLNKVNDYEREDRIKANDNWLKIEEAKLVKNLALHEGNLSKLKEQEAQNNIQRESNLKKHGETKAAIEQDYRKKEKQNLESFSAEWESIIQDRFKYKKRELLASELEEIKVLNDKLSLVKKGSEEEKTILRDIQIIKVKYFNQNIDIEIAKLKRKIAYTKELEKQKVLLNEISILENSKKSNPSLIGDSSSGGIDAELADYISASQSFLDEAFALGDAIYERKISNIEKEIAAETAKYDELIRLAKNDDEEIKILERNKEQRIEQLNKKKRKEQIKQAKLDKALQISQAISGTALAVIRALDFKPPASFIFAGLAAAAGAAQLAAIIATPIPQFAQGGVMSYDGKALINDGGRQEYVERNGQVLTTGKTNAVVDLQKGDVIHKDFEELQRKTMLLSLTSGGESVTEKQLNLAYGIKEEIKDGFKKAKVNSNITVVSDKNNYRDKMSMW